MVRKAVILVAGYGTRFLPATKAQPKEMLPVIDTPAVQLSVEEAINAGIEDIILITGSSKRAIEDHFDANADLESRLKSQKKFAQLESITRIQRLANFIYVRQPQPLGNGHATLMAEAAVGNEPFVLLYPDDLIVSKKNSIQEMIRVYEEYEAPVMGLLHVQKKDVSKYGIAKVDHIRDHIYEISRVVEKPSLAQAPSQLASLKGFVFPPAIFEYLRRVRRGKDGEIWLPDAVDLYNKSHAVFGCELQGEVFDLGSKLGWLKANVAFALKRPELRKEFRAYLKKVV